MNISKGAIMKRIGLASVALAVVLVAAMVLSGSAFATTLCLQTKANGAVKGPETVGGSKCKSGYEAIELPSANELEVLKHATYEPEGIDRRPTVVFSGVNVQVVNGEGKTATTNGEGNLVIGYDENPGTHEQTGSHNLVLGEEQTFTSYGGILAGSLNTSSAPFASVSGGEGNTANGTRASVDGGFHNTASGGNSWAGGGSENVSEGNATSISGGKLNKASGPAASISGGEQNTASGKEASVSGGGSNIAGGPWSWIGGGGENEVKDDGLEKFEGQFAAILGDKKIVLVTDYGYFPEE
jgi:hypothetical protein